MFGTRLMRVPKDTLITLGAVPYRSSWTRLVRNFSLESESDA